MADDTYIRSRASRVSFDHDLPPYEPKEGDIVTGYHVFNDPKEPPKIHPVTGKKMDRGKFRQMICVWAKDDNYVLVPTSSLKERDGHHVAFYDKEELAALGFHPNKPAFGKVLESAVYDKGHPLVLPSRNDDGELAWVHDTASEETVIQILAEVSRQKKKENFKKFKERQSKYIPEDLIKEMRQVALKAQRHHEKVTGMPAHPSPVEAQEPEIAAPTDDTPPVPAAAEEPRRKLPPGVVRAAEGSVLAEEAPAEPPRRKLPAGVVRAAPGTITDEMPEAPAEEPRRRLPPGVVRAAPGTLTSPPRDMTLSEFNQRKAEAAPAVSPEISDRAERVQETTEALARRKRCHPEQIAQARAGAEAVARSRGLDQGETPEELRARKKAQVKR